MVAGLPDRGEGNWRGSPPPSPGRALKEAAAAERQAAGLEQGAGPRCGFSVPGRTPCSAARGPTAGPSWSVEHTRGAAVGRPLLTRPVLAWQRSAYAGVSCWVPEIVLGFTLKHVAEIQYITVLVAGGTFPVAIETFFCIAERPCSAQVQRL